MAKFYVGQRVKLVYDVEASCGVEGRIVEFVFFKKGTESRSGDILPWDADCTVQYDDDGEYYTESTHRLEPIVDDGRRVISWEEMKDLWTPKELNHV